MKFLLFQFALYAFVAMVVGAVLAALWARSTSSSLRRAFERSQRALTYETESNARLRASRLADHRLIGEATDLASKLLELRSALALVEADVRANQMARAEAERARDVALERVDQERGLAGRAAQSAMEATARGVERDQLKISLQRLRIESVNAAAASRAENDALRGELGRFARTHDSSVVESQIAISDAEIRAEDARAAHVALTLENQRLRREIEEMTTSRLIVLHEGVEVSPHVGSITKSAMDALQAVPSLESMSQ